MFGNTRQGWVRHDGSAGASLDQAVEETLMVSRDTDGRVRDFDWQRLVAMGVGIDHFDHYVLLMDAQENLIGAFDTNHPRVYLAGTRLLLQSEGGGHPRDTDPYIVVRLPVTVARISWLPPVIDGDDPGDTHIPDPASRNVAIAYDHGMPFAFFDSLPGFIEDREHYLRRMSAAYRCV